MSNNRADNISTLLAITLELSRGNIPSDETVDKLAQLFEVKPLYSKSEIIKKVRQWIDHDGEIKGE